MRVTIIGYGRMGREIEKTLLDRGHDIILRIDKENTDDFHSGTFARSDVAIEFSTPDTAFSNISNCINSGIPVVSGTTGWSDKIHDIEELVQKKKGSFLYASNFSLGVNILFNLNRRLASIMNGIPAYTVSLTESHHINKKDAPSGTAITLAEDIIRACDKYDSWTAGKSPDAESIEIDSVREGEVPGTHNIEWKSEMDSISLEHRAYSRKGFALGAVFAAEYIHDKQGVFTMNQLLGF